MSIFFDVKSRAYPHNARALTVEINAALPVRLWRHHPLFLPLSHYTTPRSINLSINVAQYQVPLSLGRTFFQCNKAQYIQSSSYSRTVPLIPRKGTNTSPQTLEPSDHWYTLHNRPATGQYYGRHASNATEGLPARKHHYPVPLSRSWFPGLRNCNNKTRDPREGTQHLWMQCTTTSYLAMNESSKDPDQQARCRSTDLFA